jgi:N-acetylmuramic acid 6-phosphate etherase
MSTPSFSDPRLTEQRNPRSDAIDVASAGEIVDLMHAEDRGVPEAVYACRDAIARTIELVVAAFRAGGRLIYVGAGTSGRLGVLDATECPPTFGTSPDMVVGIIAGGLPALTRSQEGAEDDVAAAVRDLDARGVSANDVVLGIAASGTTPYVRSALGRAQRLGAKTVLLTCSEPPADLAAACDVAIWVQAGPEVLTGSTRLKAGTATKLVLNTVTTGAMIRLGKAYGNLMVDLMAWSEKLKDRAERIVMETCGVDRETARAAIAGAQGSVKLAIVMVRRNVRREEAERLLAEAGGLVRRAAGDPPPVA